MKRRSGALIAAVLLFMLMLSGCKRAEGYDTIDKAREKYEKLDSAKLTITDAKNSDVIQEFTFKYEGDTLTYLYMGADTDGSLYYEFYNGEEYDVYSGGKWTSYPKGNDKCVSYTRKNPNPKATKDIFFLVGSSIAKGEIKKLDNGGQSIYYQYDCSKLNGKMQEQLTSMGRLTAFETTFTIDADGEIVEMLERSALVPNAADSAAVTDAVDSGSSDAVKANTDAAESDTTYRLVVSDRNAVEAIEKPDLYE